MVDERLARWVMEAEQSAVGPGRPNPIVRVESVERESNVVTATVVLWDGKTGVLRIVDDLIPSYQWLRLEGDPFSWENDQWRRASIE